MVRGECEPGECLLDRRHGVREDTGKGLVDEEEEDAHQVSVLDNPSN